MALTRAIARRTVYCMASYFEWAEVSCPYCGETSELSIDTTGDHADETVEDCPTCCRPWQVRVVTHGDTAEIVVTRLSED